MSEKKNTLCGINDRFHNAGKNYNKKRIVNIETIQNGIVKKDWIKKMKVESVICTAKLSTCVSIYNPRKGRESRTEKKFWKK